MIVLSTTTESLKAYLGGAVATTQPTFVISYADHVVNSSFTPGQTHGSFNSTTEVTLAAAPAASTKRIIKGGTIYNIDTASVVVYVILDDNSTNYIMFKTTLLPGETYDFELGKIGSTGSAIIASDADMDTSDTLATGIGDGYGIFMVRESTTPLFGVFSVRGTTITMISTDELFTTIKDTASSMNVYSEGGDVIVQNKVGDNLNVAVSYWGIA